MGIPLHFDNLVRRFHPNAYRFAYRLTKNSSDAHDLVQDAFLKAYLHWDHYDTSRPFYFWLYQILRRTYLDRKKRPDYRLLSYGVMPDTVSSLPQGHIDNSLLDRLIHNDYRLLLHRVFQQLPSNYRLVITLADIECRPLNQIAALLRCPLETVRTQLSRGRKLLRKMYRNLDQKANWMGPQRAGWMYLNLTERNPRPLETLPSVYTGTVMMN